MLVSHVALGEWILVSTHAVKPTVNYFTLKYLTVNRSLCRLGELSNEAVVLTVL